MRNDSQMAKTRAQQEKEWQAQSDLSTLRQAEQIKTDKARVTAAKAMAQKEVQALKRVVSVQAKKAR